jgi:FMN-dependent dehydrogenase
VMAPFQFAYVAGKDGRVTGNAVAVKANLSWDDVGFCREQTGLPVFVKGILSSAQALEAERHGCAGVWLSNHGGRQLDKIPSAMTVLPRVADGLKGRLPIIIDGGVYRGQDVFRALALGASGRAGAAIALRLRAWRCPGRSRSRRAPQERACHDDAARRHADDQEHRPGRCRAGGGLGPRLELAVGQIAISLIHRKDAAPERVVVVWRMFSPPRIHSPHPNAVEPPFRSIRPFLGGALQAPSPEFPQHRGASLAELPIT